MITIFLILSGLAATALANEPIECSFGNTAEVHQCHGAEGQELIFHLSNQTNTEITLTKDGKYRILKRNRDGTATLDDKYVNQFEKIQNGKIKLGKATKEHSGEYLLEQFSFTDGKRLKTVSLRLNIYAAVSEPVVSQTCLSPDLMTVSCSAEGDDVNLTLFLDKNKLIQTRSAENKGAVNVTISLYCQLEGNLMCDVQNKVSRKQRIIQLTSCKGAFIVAAVVKTSVIVLLLVSSAFCGLKFFKQKKSLTTAKNGDPEEETVNSAVEETQLQ